MNLIQASGNVLDVRALFLLHGGALPAPLEPLPIQYGDFARWQRRRLEGDRLAAHLAYWKRELADVPAL